ncbi:MAG: IS66 family insertion sequence element accessory protein TnpB [Hahellaceae bacterium]|nr:IS66 family insertion sequence element accessory protein TnpB [Hahellaceae bacterium]MCP5169089.1 IS66 family insertion sequence element accessory protein TnpB [Hahellaceae bacterium]MCP5170112.1 IS66 family insertion sequence element accessory protein TnpB [Hahellaceae bacterium]
MHHAAPRKHRSAADWQALLRQWQQSALSAPAFCRQKQIGYASFCQWRKRLAMQTDEQVEISPPPDFIALSGLAAAPAQGNWHLWLKLGPWVEVRIGRR